MVVPLGHILAQQPPIASLHSILEGLTDSDGQLAVFEAHKQVLDSTYKDDVLRQFITILEREGQEVIEEIWESFYELKSQVLLSKGRESQSNVKYDLLDNTYVKIEESRATLVSGGQTGHRTWESSLVFTDFVCQNRAQFENIDYFLELGCGTGLVSMAMAKLGLADRIVATDGSEVVLSRLEKSIGQNDLNSKLEVQGLDWTDLECVKQVPKSAVVFAGDILYGLESLYPSILDALEILEPQCVLLCNPIRKESSYERFKQLCADRNIGFKVLKRYEAKSAEETDFMFIVSVPPIPLEIIELTTKST